MKQSLTHVFVRSHIDLVIQVTEMIASSCRVRIPRSDLHVHIDDGIERTMRRHGIHLRIEPVTTRSPAPCTFTLMMIGSPLLQ